MNGVVFQTSVRMITRSELSRSLHGAQVSEITGRLWTKPLVGSKA